MAGRRGRWDPRGRERRRGARAPAPRGARRAFWPGDAPREPTVRIPVPLPLAALVRRGLERGEPEASPFWLSVERRIHALVRAHLPPGARGWRSRFDQDAFAFVVRLPRSGRGG